jgi:hypothetical protein
MGYHERIMKGKGPMHMHPYDTVHPFLNSPKLQRRGCRVEGYAIGFWCDFDGDVQWVGSGGKMR